jgi:hypothetical protein
MRFSGEVRIAALTIFALFIYFLPPSGVDTLSEAQETASISSVATMGTRGFNWRCTGSLLVVLITLLQPCHGSTRLYEAVYILDFRM